MLGTMFPLLAVAGLFAATAQAAPPSITLYDGNTRQILGVDASTALSAQHAGRVPDMLGSGLRISLLPLFGAREAAAHNFTTAIDPLAASPNLAPSVLTREFRTPPTLSRGSHFDRMPQNDRHNVGLGGFYRKGNLTLGLSWHLGKQALGTFDTPADHFEQEEWFAGGRYDFGPASLSASWQEFRADPIRGAQWKDRIWQISSLVPITRSGSLLAGYARLDGGNGGDEASAWTLAYTHSVSPRTTAYAGYRHFNNGDFAGTGVLPAARFNERSGEGGQGLVLGVRHAF